MSLRPWYNQEANYQTNAKSFMDYLARTNKFLEVLIEDYEIFQELVLEELERMKFDSEMAVDDILVKWLEDGTLERIINDGVLGNKADKEWTIKQLDDLKESMNSMTSDINVNKQEILNKLNVSKFDIEKQNILDNIETKLSNEDHNDFKNQVNKRFNNMVIDVTQEPWNVKISKTEDSSQAIQNVFDNAPIRSTLYFPNGDYLIKQPLKLNKEMNILGDFVGGNGGTIFNFDLTETGIEIIAFEIMTPARHSSIDNLYLKNISVSGDFQGMGNSANTEALAHLTVTNVWTVGFSSGFLFRNIFLSRFINCYAVQGLYGFRFLGHSTSLIFIGCYANRNRDNWVFKNTIYSTFISAASDNASRYGYDLENCKGLSFISSASETSGKTAMNIIDCKGIIIDGFLSHRNGTDTSSSFTDIGTSIHIDNDSKSVMINGFVEDLPPETHNRSYCITTGWTENSQINGVVASLPIFTRPTVLVDGQRRSNVTPTDGHYKTGDIVYRNNYDGTGLYGWIYTASKTWVELIN